MSQENVVSISGTTTISLTSQELLEAQQALQNLESLLLDTKTAYWLGKALKKIRIKYNQNADRVNKARQALIESYDDPVEVDSGKGDGTTVKNGQFKVPPEKVKEFNDAFAAIMNEHIDFEITKVSLSKLGDARISPADVGALEWMLTE